MEVYTVSGTVSPVFDIAYLIVVFLLGILILQSAQGRRQYILFGVMAIILGCGDAFHLLPRMLSLFTTGTTSLPGHAAALGFGKQVTSITMTVFYVMLYHIWQLRYKGHNVTLTFCLYALALCRIILCLLPQNNWLSPDAPFIWGIYRNIPFVIMGLMIIVLYFQQARKNNDDAFRFMWLAIALSFAFYIPVVLFADTTPAIGMLC